MTIRPTRALLAASVVLSACAAPQAPTPPAGGEGSAANVSLARRQAPAAIAGRLMAPANVLGGAALIGSDGGSLVGSDAASLVGTDGASLIGNDAASFAGRRGLLAATARGLAGAQVILADGAGKPIAGVKPATTDAEGRYRLEGVPTAGAFRVLAGVRTAAGPARLETLVRSDAGAADAEISGATTLVAAMVAQGPRLSNFDHRRFALAVSKVAKVADDAAMPDWADRAGVKKAADLVAAKTDVADLMAELARDMAASTGPDVPPDAGTGLPPADAASAAPTGGSALVTANPPTIAPASGAPASQAPAEPSPSAAASIAPSVAPSVTAAPTAAPTPGVQEMHDARAGFRRTDTGASPWSYWWLDGTNPLPMVLVGGGTSDPYWLGGTTVRGDQYSGECYVREDGSALILDPSAADMDGPAAAWRAPGDGTVQVLGVASVGAGATDGVVVSVRNGGAQLRSERLQGSRLEARIDTDKFAVTTGTLVWLWSQPAGPVATNATRFQATILFTPYGRP